jgi:hypothetical protein
MLKWLFHQEKATFYLLPLKVHINSDKLPVVSIIESAMAMTWSKPGEAAWRQGLRIPGMESAESAPAVIKIIDTSVKLGEECLSVDF